MSKFSFDLNTKFELTRPGFGLLLHGKPGNAALYITRVIIVMTILWVGHLVL